MGASAVLVNVVLLLGAGLLLDFPFRWRRYPAALAAPLPSPAPAD